jgi:single-stranded DNA-binding protein
MSVFALVTGILFKPPEQRASKTGKPFVAATIRIKDGDTSQWVRAVAFSESAQAELMRLADGDAVSVQGAFKAELYRPDGGEPKVSLSIIADQVLGLRQPPKERKAAKDRNVPLGGARNFVDSIPFGAP